MSTLIFDNTLTGHHLEYINHIYQGALKSTGEYVFAVPGKEWRRIKDKLDWPPTKNIRMVMLDDDECHKVTTGSLLSRCIKISRFIRRIALQEKVDKIKLISLAETIPVLPLILPSRIKLSGIIYKIYLRSSKKGFRKWLDILRYRVLASSKSVEKVFILNDPSSASKLNDIYDTDKFISLADPVPEPDMTKVVNLRESMGIPADSQVFLHFGAMDERKGTLDILDAINCIDTEDLQNKYFIFAGIIAKPIESQFFSKVEEVEKNGAKIIIRNEFCTYEMLYSLCYSSDCILIPYHFTDLSSGALGYAALFGKPVIGPATGLIGELIHTDRLGTTLSVLSPETLAKAICTTRLHPIISGYAERCSNVVFADTFIHS